MARTRPVPALLERVIARGHFLEEVAGTSPMGWETQVAARLGFVQPEQGPRAWLGCPVTLIPGMTDLVARPVADLTLPELEQLCASLREEFAREELTREELMREAQESVPASLTVLPSGWVELRLAAEGRWEEPPPSRLLGRPLQAYRLRTPVLRRLQTLNLQIQMHWYTHPVNAERVARTQAPVHGLLFWSPGIRDAGSRPLSLPLPQGLAGGGALGQWLAQQAGLDWYADPLAPAAHLGIIETHHRTDCLQTLVQEVIEPCLALLESGQREAVRWCDPGVGTLHLERRAWQRGRWGMTTVRRWFGRKN
jgi:hypothetical protein